MSWFPRPVGPVAALRDLRAFMRQRSREQVIGASLAVLITAIILIQFMVDSKINTAPPAQVIYAESFPANRTDAEIVADQQNALAQKKAIQAERQRQFQQLQNQLGIE